MTNYHVIKGAEKLEVALADGQKKISDRIHVYEYAGEYDDFVFKTLRKTTPNAEKACQ